jgi:hypothetical protein
MVAIGHVDLPFQVELFQLKTMALVARRAMRMASQIKGSGGNVLLSRALVVSLTAILTLVALVFHKRTSSISMTTIGEGIQKRVKQHYSTPCYSIHPS